MLNISKDKFKGSLYGIAIGDAFGVTTEYLTSLEIKKIYKERIDIIGKGWLNLYPGEVTDPSETAFCVCNALESTLSDYNFPNPKQNLTPAEYSRLSGIFLNKCCDAYTAWYDRHPYDMETCCKNVIRQCRNLDYEQWITFSHNEDTDETNNLFSCLPLILCGQDTELLLSLSRLTHNNELCDTYLLKFRQLVEDCLYGRTLPVASEPLPKRYRHIQHTLIHASQHLATTDSFERAVYDAVNDGGDTDAIAALTGCLAGARYGFQQIPERWISQLQPDVREKLDHYTEVLSFAYEK